MPSWNEIQAMSDAEVAAANKKLVKMVVLTRIVLPIALTAASIIIVKKLEKSDPIVD